MSMVNETPLYQFFNALHLACDAHPKQRICQVIANAVGADSGSDIYYLSDDLVIELLEAYAEEEI